MHGLSKLIVLSLFRPREAAVAIVNYINHRNPNVSLLALNVGSFRPSVFIGRKANVT